MMRYKWRKRDGERLSEVEKEKERKGEGKRET